MTELLLSGLDYIALYSHRIQWTKDSSTCGQPKIVCRGTAELQPHFCQTRWGVQSVAGWEGGRWQVFLFTSFGLFNLPQNVKECNCVWKYTH